MDCPVQKTRVAELLSMYSELKKIYVNIAEVLDRALEIGIRAEEEILAIEKELSKNESSSLLRSAYYN